MVLQPGALAHQMGPSVHEPTSHPGLVIRDPRLGQEVRGQQLGEDPSIDLVGLDPRLGDRPRLARVRHHHPRRQRTQHRGDRVAVRRCLQSDLVVALEGHRPRTQVLRAHTDPALVPTQPVLDHGDLRERAMHVHPDRSHIRLLASRPVGEEPLGGERQKRIRARSAVRPVAGAARY